MMAVRPAAARAMMPLCRAAAARMTMARPVRISARPGTTSVLAAAGPFDVA